MTSPTVTIGDSEPEATSSNNIPTRQTTHPRPLDELENGLISPNSSPLSPIQQPEPQLSPGTASQERRSITQNIQENTNEIVRYWNRFSRKGKKNIGVMVSMQALAFSSCTILFSSA